MILFSSAGRAALLAAAMSIPFLASLGWAHLVLSPTITATGLLAAACAGLAFAVLALLAGTLPRTGGRRAAVITILVGLALGLPSANGWPWAAVLAGLWLTLFIGEHFSHRAIAWMTGTQSRKGVIAAHLLAVTADLSSYGAIALLLASALPTAADSRIAATAVVLVPLLALRAIARHHPICDTVHRDGLLLTLRWYHRQGPRWTNREATRCLQRRRPGSPAA